MHHQESQYAPRELSHKDIAAEFHDADTQLERAATAWNKDREVAGDYLLQVKATLTKIRNESTVGMNNRDMLNRLWVDAQTYVKRGDTSAGKRFRDTLQELSIYSREETT